AATWERGGSPLAPGWLAAGPAAGLALPGGSELPWPKREQAPALQIGLPRKLNRPGPEEVLMVDGSQGEEVTYSTLSKLEGGTPFLFAAPTGRFRFHGQPIWSAGACSRFGQGSLLPPGGAQP